MAHHDRSNGAGRAEQPVVIRKYANRRLYNTGTTEFVTLDDIRKMVVAGDSSSILAQIVAEHEPRGEAILPHEVLRQIISAYEQGVSAQLSDYLKSSMETFTDNWRRLDALGEIGRQNLKILRNSMTTIFAQAAASPRGVAEPPEPEPDANLEGQVSDLKAEIRELRRQLGERATPPQRKKPPSKPRPR